MIYQITSVVLLIFTSINGQEYNNCVVTRTNQPGICKIVTDCKSVQDDMITRRREPTICGHINLVPVVCCPVIKKQKPAIIFRNRFGWNQPSKSEQKCIEYSNYVFTNTTSIYRCPSIECISSGEEAKPKEFPHMALLGFEEFDKSVSWSCGGSLISRLYVLTAGHCLTSSTKGLLKFVRLGDLITDTNEDDAMPIEFKINRIIRNPNYSSVSKYHDIALLRLNETVIFNPYVRPLCLPTLPFNPDRDRIIATGWGRTENDEQEQSPALLKVFLQPFSHVECNKYYGNDRNRKLARGIDDNIQVCAGSMYEKKDTCQGDSGGPLQTFHKTQYCMFTIVAVTSFGKSCGSIKSLGVYTRVFPYVEWIESVVWPT